MIRYRADINGLRAVAVVPIVLFHAGYEWMPGGFIGVDIFFVISGYLISSILLDEMSQGKFSFIRFYERRVRRIVPALLLVLLTTLIAGYFLLLPAEYMDLSESALAAATFVPNVYFWDTTTTYFGLDNSATPLLHTWSLGVEEQFYILFPIILYVLIRLGLRKTTVFVMVSLLLSSLAANIIVVGINPELVFYMLPTRVWELLTGVVLSLGIFPHVKRTSVANPVALLGAGLVVFPLFTLDEFSVFPGVNAILPVLGTALIIYSGEHSTTVVSRILGHKIPVAIGLVSYSLYLWHWPVTVYTNLRWESGLLNRPFIIILSLGLAWLSYRFIETRFRHHASQPFYNRKLALLGIPAALTLLVPITVLMNDGMPGRVPRDAWTVVSVNDDEGPCRQFSENPELHAHICPLGSGHQAINFVLWGDSHAGAISGALHLAASELGLSGVLLSSHGCQPLSDVYREGSRRCQTFNSKVLAYIRTHPSIDHVFLAGYWRIPFTGQGYDSRNVFIMDDKTALASAAENPKVFRRGMERTMDALTGVTTSIIQDIPEIGAQFGKSFANNYVRQVWIDNTLPGEPVFKTGMDSFEQEFREMLASIDYTHNYMEVLPLLCPDNTCPLISGGKLVYRDGDHLSEYGASLLAPLFLRYFEIRTAAKNELHG
ncbi:MAG: acyltransferase family protein [Thiogranum sp.]